MSLFIDVPKVQVLRPYLLYVFSFVGAGMVSGGVVHYPLNESYYGILAVLGGFVFAIGAIANELSNGKGFLGFRALFSLILTSLLLSFGIGMFAGGIQHFTDFPSRAAVLVPLGIVLSFIAFCLKSKLFRKSSLKKVLVASSLVLSTAVVSLFVLMNIADGLNAPAHTHGEEKVSSNLPAEDHSKHPHNK